MTIVRKYLFIFGGFFFVVSAVQLARFFVQAADIWWTPMALAVPLANTSDRVQVYVRDAALGELLEAGRLQLVSESSATPVAGADVRLRFNNWDRVRAERIPALVGAGIALGASAVFLLIGALGWGPLKSERARD